MSDNNKDDKYVSFDDTAGKLIIHNGDDEEVSYESISKVSVQNEDENFKGEGTPFVHTVFEGASFFTFFGGPNFYVGDKLTLKDGTVKAIYVSEKPTTFGTDIYRADKARADHIKAEIDQRIK